MKTYVTHYRFLDGGLFSTKFLRKFIDKFDEIDPCGGMTVVNLVDENNVVVATGSAKCSRRDNYNKKIGRLIAEGRARKMLETLNA